MRDLFSNRYRGLAAALLAAVLFGVVFGGCLQRSQSAPRAGRAIEAASGGAERPDSRGPAGRDEPVQTAEPDDPAEVRVVNDSEETERQADADRPDETYAPRFLLVSRSLRRATPSDAAIGELPDIASDNSARAAVRNRIVRLFDDLDRLQEGIAEHVIEPERDRLARMVADDLRVTPQDVQLRLGPIRWLDVAEATALVRLVSSTGRTEGDVVLEDRGDGWYIADILLDLGALSQSRVTRGTRLEPWVDHSPLVGP